MESQIKSIGKAISWRIIASCVTGILVYSATKRIDVSGLIAGAEVMAKLILYYIHERVWARFKR